MKLKQKRAVFLYLLLTAFLFLITVFSGQGVLSANAAIYDNSSALKDLKQDRSFNADDYPAKNTDYGIYVIQIGESEKGNLYVYTYQPCQRSRYLIASDINMSLSESVDDTELYELILVNISGVFGKYLVKGVTVSDASTRYYNVTSIYRAWDEELDKGTGNNNTVDKVAFSVRSIYKVTTENGEIKYECEPTYVVTIINPYSDFLTFDESLGNLSKAPTRYLSLHRKDCYDAHYIAFSTDWEIDRLMSATVTYSYCSGTTSGNKFLFWKLGSNTTYGTEYTDYAYPTYEDKFDVTGAGYPMHRYNWERIQTVPEFLSKYDTTSAVGGVPMLTQETKDNLNGKQWILFFTETDRKYDEIDVLFYANGKVKFTDVRKVAILRLEFETDGVTYNLGAVSDMVSGDGKPGNWEDPPEEDNKIVFDKIGDFFNGIGNFFANLWNSIVKFFTGLKWWEWLLLVLGVLLGAGLIVSLIIFGVKAVFKGIWWCIKKLFKGLWWLVTLPFRLIAKAIKNRKKE